MPSPATFVACVIPPCKYFSSRARLASESSDLSGITPNPFIAMGHSSSTVFFCASPAPTGSLQVRILKRDLQSCQTPKGQVFPPVHGTRDQAQVRHAAQQCLEGDLPFESCEWCSEAEVSAPCECKMPVILTADVKS